MSKISKHLRIISGITFLIFALSFIQNTHHRQKEKSDQPDSRPNIVIIMADDLDSRQLSCYGGKNLQTKNIDALASEGMKLSR